MSVGRNVGHGGSVGCVSRVGGCVDLRCPKKAKIAARDRTGSNDALTNIPIGGAGTSKDPESMFCYAQQLERAPESLVRYLYLGPMPTTRTPSPLPPHI